MLISFRLARGALEGMSHNSKSKNTSQVEDSHCMVKSWPFGPLIVQLLNWGVCRLGVEHAVGLINYLFPWHDFVLECAEPSVTQSGRENHQSKWATSTSTYTTNEEDYMFHLSSSGLCNDLITDKARDRAHRSPDLLFNGCIVVIFQLL